MGNPNDLLLMRTRSFWPNTAQSTQLHCARRMAMLVFTPQLGAWAS